MYNFYLFLNEFFFAQFVVCSFGYNIFIQEIRLIVFYCLLICYINPDLFSQKYPQSKICVYDSFYQ